MFNIRQWVTRIADNDQSREASFQSHVDNGTEGFICPVCMLNCEEAGLLADHFNSKHSGGLVPEDPNSLRDDLIDAVTIEKKSAIDVVSKNSANDVTHQNQPIDDLLIKHKALENKAASIATENVTLKAQIDDMNSVNSSQQVRISLLESQLAHKNTIDDASVLRQELVSVQRMMDSLTVEKEKEIDKMSEHLKRLQREHDEVADRCRLLESENTLLSEKVEELNLKDTKPMEELQRQLESSKGEIKELNVKLVNHVQELDKAKLGFQKESLRNDEIRNAFEKELDELKMKCSRMEAINTNLESIIKDKDDVISELKRSHLEQNTLSESVQKSNTVVMELQKEVQDLKTKNCMLEQENITLTSVSKQNQDETNKTADKLLLLKSLLDETKQTHSKVEENLKKRLDEACVGVAKIKLKFEEAMMDKAKLSENLQKLNDEKTQMKLEFDGSLAKTTNQQLELERLSLETSRLTSELESSLKEINQLKSELESSTTENRTINSNFEKLTSDMAQLRSELNVSQDENIRSTSALELSQSLLTEKQDRLEAVINEKSQLIESHNKSCAELAECEKKFQASLATMAELKDTCSEKSTKLDQRNVRIKEMEGEKQRLEIERTSLLETLECLTTDKQNLLLSLEDIQTQLKEKDAVIEILKGEKDHLQEERGRLQGELESSKKLKEEDLAKSIKEQEDLLIKVRNLKGEVEMWTERYKDEKNREQGLLERMETLQENNNELQSEVRRYEDQEKCLLERCLASQAESEDIQGELNTTRRKLEDSQAALHELGRESQTLQMEIAKMTGRKWTDDSLVSMCESCQKEFSLTVRKHHCRNCGNIFCKDCSSRSATLPSSKKPVRVCDNCYQELMKMGMKSG